MWPNPQFPADLVTFNEEILNGNLHFLCSVMTRNVVFIARVKPLHDLEIYCMRLIHAKTH